MPAFLAGRALLEARRGRVATARRMLARAADLKPGGTFGRAGIVPSALAQIERMAGDLPAARKHLAAAEAGIAEDSGAVTIPQRSAHLAVSRVMIELAAGDVDAARPYLREAAAAAERSQDGPVTAVVAEAGAQLALADRDPGTAAELLGIAMAQRGTLDMGSPDVTAALAAVRAALGAAADGLMTSARSRPRADGAALLVSYSERRSAVVPMADARQ